jgi:ubiquitin-conjugating enzyme E2 O
LILKLIKKSNQHSFLEIAIFYYSFTGTLGQLNPNLYDDGKVCLSLLGTWHGKESETWSQQSSLFQLLVSIQSLVLNARPYFNEAGYDRLEGTVEGEENSVIYNEQVLILTLQCAKNILCQPPIIFKGEIYNHYISNGNLKVICDRAEQIITNSETLEVNNGQSFQFPDKFPITRVSLGCKSILEVKKFSILF